VSSIFVTSNGYLTGIVSRKDFLKNLMGGLNLNKTPIGIIMTRMPYIVFVRREDSILDAAIKIIDHEIDGLPIVEEVADDAEEKAYKVVGRVTKTSITRLFVELGRNE